MKWLQVLIILSTVVFFTNCEEDDSLKVDFEIVVTGESPNAVVYLINNSSNADLYEWEFSDGTRFDTWLPYNQQTLVDKVGGFTIKLTVTKGETVRTKTKTVVITGVNGINFFQNLKFGKSGYIPFYGEHFSCENGRVYGEYELTDYDKSIIDFVIYSRDEILFYSPEKCDKPLINGRETRFDSNTDDSFSLSDFDAIQDESQLIDLNVGEEFQITVNYDELPKIILMKDYEDKIGIIKIKEHTDEKIVIDIKMQKYPNDDK